MKQLFISLYKILVVGIRKINCISFSKIRTAEIDTTLKYGGTGLGLAIVKSLVTMQNGKLNVISEEGNGCNI
jgi:signal transduction histidine kinase